MANTSWRGLRLRFDGSLKNAYLAVAPLYVPLIAFVGSFIFMTQSPTGDADADNAAQAAAGLWILAPMGLAALATPWFIALTKRYQHGGYGIGNQRTHLNCSTWRFYVVFFKAMLVCLLPAVLVGVLAAILVPALQPFLSRANLSKPVAVAGIFALGLLGYALVLAVMTPYLSSRLQNLTWANSASVGLRFDSKLRYRAMVWLTIKNWTLTALSLYRPFAAVNMTRLRLQAVSLQSATDPWDWVVVASNEHQDATGEVAGDFFGIDIGL